MAEHDEAPALPTVTVVVPCFNYARFVAQAVRSALSQHGVEVDVVVVDDASTDGSRDVVAAVVAQDARVRLVVHEQNAGPVRTFNDGLALARGEFVVRLDADDLLTPGSLERAVAVCRAHPEVGMVYGHPLHFADDPPPARTEATGWTCWSGTEWLADRCRTGVNVITSPEVLMRRCVVDVVGGQRDLRHTHDMEMWMRLAAAADVAYIHGADQAWHREHAASLSTSADDPLGLGILRERRDAFETLFADPVVALPDAALLARTARRTLAADALRRACYEFDRRRAPRRSVADLVELADSLDPDHALAGWRGLRRRQAAGRRWPLVAPWPVLVNPLRRARRDRRRDRYWHDHGVYAPLPARVVERPAPTPTAVSTAPVDDLEGTRP